MPNTTMDVSTMLVNIVLLIIDVVTSFDLLSQDYYPPHQVFTMSDNSTLVLQQTSCIPPGSMRSCSQVCQPQGDVYPVCHCDNFCELFGDCCKHYHRCAKEAEEIDFHKLVDKILPYLDFLECRNSVHDHVWDWYFGEYMIRRCPEKYRNPVIRKKCEKLEIEVTRLQPVTDRKSGVTFRNLYCAQCHRRGLDDTIPWAYAANRCGQITPQMLIWTYFELRDLELRRGFCAPKILEGVTHRSCKSATVPIYKQMQKTEQMIASCPDINDHETERKCRAHLDPILGLVNGEPKAFRNEACARCHGLETKNLFCAPFEVVRPDDIQYPSVQRPSGIANIPSLRDLLQIPEEPCQDDEFRDPFTRTCRSLNPCRLGQVFYKQFGCVMNPVDKYAYHNPVFSDYGERHILSVVVELQFSKPLIILLNRKTSLENEFKVAFEQSRPGMIGTGSGSITSLRITGRIDDLPIRDGHIFTLSGPITLNFKVKIKNGRREPMVRRILKSMLLYNDKFYDTFRARFRIFSQAVDLPLRCSSGNLISLQLNNTFTKLLGTLGQENITEHYLVEYNHNINTEHVYPKLHLCNLVLPKFQNCSLLNYTAALFTKSSTGIVSDFGSINSGDYFISRDLIFTCMEMITGKQDLLHAKVLGYITIAGFLISLLFLFYTLLTYCLFAQLRTTPGKMIMNLSGILFLAKISLLISKLGVNNRVICSMIGLVQHYLWITMFACMNAIALFTVRTFTSKSLRSPGESKRAFRFAMAYTYGVPILIIAVCLGLHLSHDQGIYGALTVASSCWIKSTNIFLYAFVTPLCILLVANFILFLATTRAIHATRASTSVVAHDHSSKWEISLYVRLSFLMGFTWIFGVLGIFYQSLALNYLFVMANSLTGVYLAVGFMCTGRVFDLYKNRNQKPRPASVKSPVYSLRSERKPTSLSAGLTDSSSSLGPSKTMITDK